MGQTQWEVQTKIDTKDTTKEDTRDIVRGIIVEVNGSIEGSRNGLVWFKSLEDNTVPFEVYGAEKIQNIRPNMYCLVERHPKAPARWTIINFDEQLYFDNLAVYGSLPGASLQPHADEHEQQPGKSGSDPVNIYSRAIVEFKVVPTSPASMKVQINGGWYAGSTNYERFTPTLSKNFTSDIPGSSGMALIVAITIDNTGTIQYYNGTQYVDALPYIPSTAYPTTVPKDEKLLSAVRLVNGMTNITEANFNVEMRSIVGAGGNAGVTVLEVQVFS